MEAIEGIKIIQLEGLGGMTGNAGGGSGAHGSADHSNGSGGGNLSDQLVSAALRYRGQAPLVDALLKDVEDRKASIFKSMRPYFERFKYEQ